MEFKYCWQERDCEKPCPVRAAESVFCWRVARDERFRHPDVCEQCDYRRKWFNHEYSLRDFIAENDRRNNRPAVKRILVVDDEPNILYALEETVRAKGFDCLTAVNGEEGLFLARETVPDLIITDVVMPKLNGYELCLLLKGDSRTSSIPLIFVTVRAMVKDVKKGFDAGADDYLVKPFKAHELDSKINALLGGAQEG